MQLLTECLASPPLPVMSVPQVFTPSVFGEVSLVAVSTAPVGAAAGEDTASSGAVAAPGGRTEEFTVAERAARGRPVLASSQAMTELQLM